MMITMSQGTVRSMAVAEFSFTFDHFDIIPQTVGFLVNWILTKANPVLNDAPAEQQVIFFCATIYCKSAHLAPNDILIQNKCKHIFSYIYLFQLVKVKKSKVKIGKTISNNGNVSAKMALAK